jgi:hypothetical protein
MVLGLAELVLAGTTSYPVAVVAVFFCGVGAIATAASANSLIQITVPGPLRGRVMAVYTTVFAGSTPVGNGLTGGFGGLFGTPVAIAMNGLVTLGAQAVAAIAVLRGGAANFGQGQDRPSVGVSVPVPVSGGSVRSVD